MRYTTLADKLLEYARKNPEGFTVKIVNGKITPVKYTKNKRFVVSKTNNTTRADVRRVFEDDYTGYAGGWFDKKTKKYYIDKNVIIRDKKRALQRARKYRQKAIFDLKDFKEITIAYRNPIKIVKGRYYNTLTKKYVSKAYGKRLRNYFENNPSGTLYRASGHGEYDRDRPIPEHSKEIKEMIYGKGTQVVRTKSASGKEVYYSPLRKEQLTPEDIKKFGKLDYYICNKKVNVELYRMTRDKTSIYHIFTWKVNRQFLDPLAFEAWGYGTALKMLQCILDDIKKNLKKIWFGKMLLMNGHVNSYFYSDIDGYDAGTTFGYVHVNESGFKIMEKEFKEIINKYAGKLESRSYHQIAIIRISVYVYDYTINTNQTIKDIAKYRLGVNRIRI